MLTHFFSVSPIDSKCTSFDRIEVYHFGGVLFSNWELFERDEHFRNERRTECVTLGIVVKRDRRDVVGNFCLYECCCVSVILKLFRREVQQMRDNRAGCGQDPDRT